jgi:hypothetical protein
MLIVCLFLITQRQGGDKAPVVYLRPNMVFFRGNDVRYEGIFEYVDFGLAGNQFLRECGVKDEPAPAELAQALSSNPQQVQYSRSPAGKTENKRDVLWRASEYSPFVARVQTFWWRKGTLRSTYHIFSLFYPEKSNRRCCAWLYDA